MLRYMYCISIIVGDLEILVLPLHATTAVTVVCRPWVPYHDWMIR